MNNHIKISYADLSRRDIRSLVFQLLYAMESYNYDVLLEDIIRLLNRGYDFDIPLDSEVALIVQDIVDKREHLDDQIKPLLKNWRFDRISVPAKLILRYALWEFEKKQLDSSIIINEAIELAKCYGEIDAYKFINGILDEKIMKNK